MEKKRYLPKLDLIKHDFVMVYWVDIESDSNWRGVDDLITDELPICISSGWLIKKDNKVTRLASDFNIDSDGKIKDIGNTTIIPTCVIQKIIKIKL
tara:strand:+ start:2279 stop:2566 length:288 start_codon:yes stop_codon:yes gene_type:complete